jgi:hypothetical protein
MAEWRRGARGVTRLFRIRHVPQVPVGPDTAPKGPSLSRIRGIR